MDPHTLVHPTDQTLSSFGLGKLDVRSAEAVNTHLEECSDCRRRVAEMSSDSFLDRVRDAQKGTGQSPTGENAPVLVPADTLPPGLADHPDYEIKKELGRGGMGVVYLAHNKLMGRDEVLKVMGREIIERPGVLDRFLREIRAVAKLRHPNIVTAYAATRLGDSIVFAMEYVEGLDLSKMVKAKGPLPVAHACNFVHQAALGLQHAHEEGLVHRDIKPANLMLSRKGEKPMVKVLDFGLAKVAREEKVDGGLTSVGQALGTPDFIAPEQILDAPSADIRADIYSLGGTLYYLLAGRPPFKANSLYDMYQAHISRDAASLNLVRPEVPSELAALVAKLMAKDPARRFQAPGEVAEALTPFFKKGNAAFKTSQTEVSQAGPVTTGVSTPTQPATDAGAPVIRPKKTVEPTVAEGHWESLIEVKATDSLLESGPLVAPVRRPARVWPSLAVGVLVFGLFAAWMGGVFKVKTPDGMIVLENLPKDAEVVVDGGKISLSWPGIGKPLEIRTFPGQHNVAVKKEGFKTFGEVVTVEANGTKEVTVRLVPLPPAADSKDTPVQSDLPAPVIVRGKWKLEDDQLIQYSKDPVALIVFGDPSWSSYDMSYKFQAARGVRCITQRSHYHSERKTILTQFGANWNTRAVIESKHEGRKLKELCSKNGPIDLGRWYQVSVHVRGPHLVYFLDGNKVLEGVDDLLTSGRVGLGSWDTLVKFRDIVISRPDGKILWKGLPKVEMGSWGSEKEFGSEKASNTAPPPSPARGGTGGPVTAVAESPAAGFVPLFNGKDLTGWTFPRGNQADWSVQDGMIRGTASVPFSIMATLRNDYGDFHLRMEINRKKDRGPVIHMRGVITPDDIRCYFFNAGGRSQPNGTVAPVGAYRIKTGPAPGTGEGLLELTAPVLPPLSPNAWHNVEIIASGNVFRMRVDGREVSAFQDTQARFMSGDIAIRMPKDGSVDIRKIEIEETKTVPKKAVRSADRPRAPMTEGARVGQERADNGLKMKFCWCPGGRFWMGSPPNEPGRLNNEDPAPVTLSRGFWMGKFEVTQAQWTQLMGTTIEQQNAKTGKPDLRGVGPAFPMYFVSHTEAEEFARKLTFQERGADRLPSNWEYRLPTEAEWEYACRAGTTTATAFGDELGSTDANCMGHEHPYNGALKGPYLAQTCPVGCYRPNACGVYDMHGNVWEWCRDGYAENLAGGVDPQGSANSSERVLRGGGWITWPVQCRSAGRRVGRKPSDRLHDLGFRLVLAQ